jgi:hypothetical protein
VKGLEPSASAVTVRRSNHLSYTPQVPQHMRFTRRCLFRTRAAGFEPAVSALTTRRFRPLSYAPNSFLSRSASASAALLFRSSLPCRTLTA